MLCFLMLLGSAVPTVSAAAHPDLPPATALSLDIAEAIGATVRSLAIAPDATLSADERATLTEALRKTGLFQLGEPVAQATITVSRVDPEMLLVTVSAADGRRLWVGHSRWPSRVPDPTTAGSAVPSADEDLYGRVLAYRRGRLEVRQVVHESWAPPLMFNADGAFYLDRRPGWGTGYATMAPYPTFTPDWGIVRGGVDVLDETDLAKLLQDDGLMRSIQEARFWPRVWWGVGFGAVGVAGLGAGSWLTWFAHGDNANVRRDQRAVGVSLLTIGVASTVLALLFPTIGMGHTMSPSDAQARADGYNTQLRQSLGLRPDDLARFNVP